MEKKEIKVLEEKRTRIDTFIADKIPELTRAKIQKMIETEKILVNNKSIKNSYKTSYNDIISIEPLEENIDLKPKKMNLDIIYEDEDLMVINKPSGLTVHPAAGNYTDTLVNGLIYYSKNLSTINGEFRPGIVHRIDKDTSGLILVAKNDETHNYLANQLKNKTINRIYISLVSGVINHNTGTIDAPIGRDKNNRKKMTVIEVNSKNAVTHFKVLERYKNATLIECKLDTGRTHQIRVHMKYINHPVINDPVYGNKKIVNNFGQMLHAKTIGFVHPKTKKYMEFSIEPPKEFNDILEIYKA